MYEVEIVFLFSILIMLGALGDTFSELDRIEDRELNE